METERAGIKDIILDFVTKYFKRVTGKVAFRNDDVVKYNDDIVQRLKIKAIKEGMRHVDIDKKYISGQAYYMTEYYIISHDTLIKFINDIVESLEIKEK